MNHSGPGREQGVLQGKWGGGYHDGRGSRAPWSWIGSPNILRTFMNTGYPAKYGQCWVFSGVMTTGWWYTLLMIYWAKI